MPNVKVYVDDALVVERGRGMEDLLMAIRGQLCQALGVDAAACHVVVLPVRSAPGQRPVNIELVLLRRPERTRDRMAELCTALRDLASDLMAAPSAVRCALMEREHYVVAG